ncbi:tRNA (guanosine(18)-2'-O)-methyltransferase [Aquipluma nitroreducens]|uniref:tRNA (guanosine(18)-2'-O)-methyltransferase n=1 Tax=Aquipluma nitroreducens TaxID=2010828 RepID=A0A5K7S5C7_9BACT|nr:RNA methyltransferase [Aquipluma nitroreducens]BBE16743.1 tRNA (guanosine(18)-2'-O)-methyltransferase [Aquipluma nitroreducens]
MDADLIQFLSGFITPERLTLFNKILSQRTNYLTVVLEDLYQTQNTSAVVRTADCFGIQNVHVIENKHAFEVNPDVVRGASNWVSVIQHNGTAMNTPEALQKLRSEGYRIVVATPHDHDVALENFDLEKGKAAIVFGCERPGLTEWAMKEADEYMKIPMVGFTESLNVSVAVAVTLHHLTHQLRNHTDIDWHLTDIEKQEILLNWLRTSIKRVDLLEAKFEELNK